MKLAEIFLTVPLFYTLLWFCELLAWLFPGVFAGFSRWAM